MKQVRTRFAPSPTGPLHIGGARSALFSYLYAKRHGGQFIVRIEDTDLERSSRESEKNILDALRWLGITWDEGIEVGGPHGPYRQTERLHTYREACDKLFELGYAYHCYCTEEELEKQREELTAAGQQPRYTGKCRHLTAEQKAAYEAEGRKPSVRFRVPDHGSVTVNDLVRGDVTFENEGMGDYIIVKSDGIPTYNFAVVIDDHLMEITHVIRGEEHLSNTPRQILIYDALGYEKPQFAHVSLILGKDRTKMSKRHGSTSCVQYQEAGYLPEALVNFLALLGWSPEGEEEIFSMEQLIAQFGLDRVAKSPAVFDLDKLNWLNGAYIRQTPMERLTAMAEPFLVEAGYLQAGETAKARLIMEAVYEKISYVKEVLDFAPIFFGGEVVFENEEAKAVMGEEQVPAVLGVFSRLVQEAPELTVESVKEILKATGKESGYKGRAVFMTIRVALTGQMHGPEMTHVIPVLGKNGVAARLASALGQTGVALA